MTSIETPQATTTSTTSNNMLPPQLIDRSGPLFLAICTHNIRGLNQNLKTQVWEQFCLTNNLNIISLTETKLSKEAFKPNKTLHYTYFWSCTNSSKAGTALMVSNHLTPHIHNIITHPGYAIAIDIFFKHDFKFRIISTYLPSDNAHIRPETQNLVIKWIQQATSQNLLPIVTGDFNVTIDNSYSSSIKYKLLQFLSYNNMYNLASYTQNNIPTWQSSRYNSQIDYIWVYHPVLAYLTSYDTEDSSTSTQSDHKILISQWSFPHAYQGKPKHKTRTRRRVFNYKVMNKESWEIFSNKVSLNLTQNNTPLTTNTPESLESS